MKKLCSLFLAAVLLLTLGACSSKNSDSGSAQTSEATPSSTVEEKSATDSATSQEASPEQTAEAVEPAAEPVAEPADLLSPGIQHLESVTIGGETTGGSFYVYAPESPHTYDILSNCMNGVIFLYPDTTLSDEAEALELIKSLGLDEISENFPAYIIIPEPLDGKNYTESDLDLYWEAQYFLAGGLVNVETQPPQGEYARHTMNTLQYVIAEGSGATFVNNVLSQHASRIAGIALFGGDISSDLPTGTSVPAYLVNASDDVASYWKSANGTDAQEGNVFYNSNYDLKKVVLAEGENSFDKENIRDAWQNVLSRATRLGVAANLVVTTMDQSEWVLMDWAELDEIGLNRYSFEFNSETGEAEYYTEYKTLSYDSVHVYVPDAVEANPDDAVPLLVTLHGGSDDPLNVVMGCGWAQKAVDENFIIVSPANEDPDYVMKVLDYVYTLYNIDHSRVYLTGFSMGGMGTSDIGKAHPDVFAAIAPMGSCGGSYVEGFDNDAYDLPTCMIVGSVDNLNIVENDDGTFTAAGRSPEAVKQAFDINNIELSEADYATNPYWGYAPGKYEVVTDKDLEWQISSYYRDDFESPLVQGVILIGAGHSNADYMATVAWNFMSRFVRNEDGSLSEVK